MISPERFDIIAIISIVFLIVSLLIYWDVCRKEKKDEEAAEKEEIVEEVKE